MSSTTDLFFSAFLLLKGHQVCDVDVIIPKKKAKFYFNIPHDEWKKLKIEFSQSDTSKIKMFIEQLKDLASN